MTEPTIRRSTIGQIEVLHAEIARLIELEKAYSRRHWPDLNPLWRHVCDTKIEWLSISPSHRANAREASAHFPRAAA